MMKEYKRVFPAFSLCGLNCGLCPRYQMEGSSKCPGCGGADFHLKHPSCAVINCNRKHDNVEYCYQCSIYPCERYAKQSEVDSFISYKNVLSDFEKARQLGLENYKLELNNKIDILEFLIRNYNDGRKKNFYCIAVNLLDLNDLQDVVKVIDRQISGQGSDLKETIRRIVSLFEDRAEKADIELKLRKPQ